MDAQQLVQKISETHKELGKLHIAYGDFYGIPGMGTQAEDILARLRAKELFLHQLEGRRLA